MRAHQLWGALVPTVLALFMTACGSEEANPSGQGPSPGETAQGGQEEEITAGGVAVIVVDHLGQDTVRQMIDATEAEEGTVGVMVRLRDRTRHNFAVLVYPPEQAAEMGEAGKCPPQRQRKGESSKCRTLDDGTIVMTNQIAEGFSDDNADGSLLMGSVVNPEVGAALAMYESYDDSPAISVAELEEILTDPRLTWLTDPEVNEAGKAVDLKEGTG